MLLYKHKAIQVKNTKNTIEHQHKQVSIERSSTKSVASKVSKNNTLSIHITRRQSALPRASKKEKEQKGNKKKKEIPRFASVIPAS
jgi:hypothetical protein